MYVQAICEDSWFSTAAYHCLVSAERLEVGALKNIGKTPIQPTRI